MMKSRFFLGIASIVAISASFAYGINIKDITNAVQTIKNVVITSTGLPGGDVILDINPSESKKQEYNMSKEDTIYIRKGAIQDKTIAKEDVDMSTITDKLKYVCKEGEVLQSIIKGKAKCLALDTYWKRTTPGATTTADTIYYPKNVAIGLKPSASDFQNEGDMVVQGSLGTSGDIIVGKNNQNSGHGYVALKKGSLGQALIDIKTTSQQFVMGLKNRILIGDTEAISLPLGVTPHLISSLSIVNQNRLMINHKNGPDLAVSAGGVSHVKSSASLLRLGDRKETQTRVYVGQKISGAMGSKTALYVDGKMSLRGQGEKAGLRFSHMNNGTATRGSLKKDYGCKVASIDGKGNLVLKTLDAKYCEEKTDPIDGVCGTRTSTCASGQVTNININRDGSTTWTCQGQDGGRDATCSSGPTANGEWMCRSIADGRCTAPAGSFISTDKIDRNGDSFDWSNNSVYLDNQNRTLKMSVEASFNRDMLYSPAQNYILNLYNAENDPPCNPIEHIDESRVFTVYEPSTSTNTWAKATLTVSCNVNGGVDKNFTNVENTGFPLYDTSGGGTFQCDQYTEQNTCSSSGCRRRDLTLSQMKCVKNGNVVDDSLCPSPKPTTLEGCNDVPVDGVCGSAHQRTLSQTPTGAALCSIGVSANVSGTGPWTRQCQGYNGGAVASCQADKTITISAQCKDYASTYIYQPATTTSNACIQGTYQDIADSNVYWYWNCLGSNNQLVTCRASIDNDYNGCNLGGTSNTGLPGDDMAEEWC